MRLGEAIRLYAAANRITTRQLAKSWQRSHATVARLMSGRPVDMMTYMAALNWLTQPHNKGEDSQ